MVSKYSLLFDVKFQSMFTIRQKKAVTTVAASILADSPAALLKKKTSDKNVTALSKE